MLQVSQLSKSYGGHVLFDAVTFSLAKNEKVGLVGRNGSGKSTLFKILLNETEIDTGEIHSPKNYQIGTLPQHIHFSKKTVLEEACQALKAEDLFNSYKIEKLLSGLGFSEADFAKDPHTFSGGYQIRINLAKILVQEPDLLLLDEPTNYLDIVSQAWLANYLKSYPGEIILITHDRDFMDQSCTSIMGLHRKKLKKFDGNTANFYRRIREEEEHLEKERLNQEAEKKHLENYINRFRASARRASQAQSRIKRLAKFDNLEALAKLRDLEFNFNYLDFNAKRVMQISDLSFSYPGKELLINQLNFELSARDRLGIIGKNGKGKSTLLNLIAGGLKADSGDIEFHQNVVMSHFGQTNIQHLDENKSVEEEIESANPKLDKTAVRSICGTMMFDQDLAYKKISVLSGGERARVLLGKILARSSNLLLLDEPTNHLDQESIEGLVHGIQKFPGALIIVTHSENLLRRLVNKLIVFDRGQVIFVNGTYDYFLEKIGWEDSEFINQNLKNKTPKYSKTELKKLRAEIIQQRARELKPLKDEIEKLEEKICLAEEKIKSINQEMLEASENGDGLRITELARGLNEAQRSIEINFAYLDKVSNDHDEKNRIFQKKLDDLEN